jgi:hypothetical protein
MKVGLMRARRRPAAKRRRSIGRRGRVVVVLRELPS